MGKLFITIISLFCASAILVGGDFERDMLKAQKLVEEGKYKVAVSKLEKLAADKKLSDEERGMASVLLATSLRKDGKVQAALGALEALTTSRGELYWQELGECCLELGQFQKAAEAAKAYGDAKSKALKADGAWIRARAEFGLKSYLDCMAWCDSFIKFAEAALKGEAEESAAAPSQLKYLLAEIDEARKLKEKAKELYEIEAYGRDYAWYRKGRSAQFKGAWSEAMDCYSNVRSGTLKDAANCYSAHCLASKGDLKEAIKAYEEFVKSDPLGLYREEALLRMSELKYVHGKSDADTKEALKDAEALVEMLPKLDETDRLARLIGINEALKKDIVDTAPKEFLKEDDCGNLIRTARRPETIDNRLTSPWYLAEISTRAFLLKGFLLGEIGNKDDAALAYKRAASAGVKVRILMDGGAVPSLLAGLAEGAYMLPGETGSKLKGPGARLVPYACFLHITERRAEAKLWLDAADAALGKSQTIFEYASMQLAKAQFLLYERKRKEAESILRTLCLGEKYKSLPHWPMATFLYANSLSADASQRERAYAMYREVAKEDRKSGYAPRALMALAVCAANNGDKKLAIDACDEIRIKFVKTPYKDAAGTLREALQEAPEGALLEPVERPSGKVLVNKRTVVIPGASQWRPDISGASPSDVLLYNLKFIGRDNCTIIRGVGVSMPPDEPQIPHAKGNQLNYVRMPILCLKGLRYNFEEIFPSLKAAASSDS